MLGCAYPYDVWRQNECHADEQQPKKLTEIALLKWFWIIVAFVNLKYYKKIVFSREKMIVAAWKFTEELRTWTNGYWRGITSESFSDALFRRGISYFHRIYFSALRLIALLTVLLDISRSSTVYHHDKVCLVTYELGRHATVSRYFGQGRL